MRANSLFTVLLVGLVSSGCDLGPVGTPPPLTQAQAQGVLTCQQTIKASAASFMHTKVLKLGLCADKILALQLKLENGLISQDEFDTKIEFVRRECENRFAAIGQASTLMANAIFNHCVLVEGIIFSTYDPLQFVVLGETDIDGFPGFSGITTLDDLISVTCLTTELFMDSALFFNIPRLVPLLALVGLDLLEDIPLDARCGALPAV